MNPNLNMMVWALGLAMAIGGYLADRQQALGRWPGERGGWIAVCLLGGGVLLVTNLIRVLA